MRGFDKETHRNASLYHPQRCQYAVLDHRHIQYQNSACSTPDKPAEITSFTQNTVKLIHLGINQAMILSDCKTQLSSIEKNVSYIKSLLHSKYSRSP